MFYVALDTNLIRKQISQIDSVMDFCFSNFVEKELPCFVRQLSDYVKICIAIPEVCLEEYIKQRIEDYKDCVKKYNEAASRLKSAYPINSPKFLSEENYAKQLRSEAKDYCREKSITIIQCMEYVDWNNMFRNSIDRKLPFNVKDGNSPFKDAMIFESCLGFAKTHPGDQIVLLTNNTNDFKLLDTVHKQNNLRIICPDGTPLLEAIINTTSSFGMDMDLNFSMSADMFVKSDDIKFKMQSAFQAHILQMEAFSSPLIAQDDNGNYEYSYNIDEDNEQVEIITNIIDGDKEDLFPLHLFFNRDNGGYLFKQCAIVVENAQGEELLNA